MDKDNHIKMDFSLTSREDRLAKVNEIIANTPAERLTPFYLDKLAKYLTDPITAQEKKEKFIYTENQMITVNKRETSYEGLASKFESGEDGIFNIIANDKNIRFTFKKQISQNDIDTIPGLSELVEAINRVEQEMKAATGKRKFLLGQQIIAMRKDQYELKNDIRQSPHSKTLIKTLAKINLEEKITIDKEGNPHSAGYISFFNPEHISLLLCNYAQLKEESWDRFDSDMKWALLDLEKLVESCLKEKYPLYYDLVIYKIDGKQNIEIQQLLNDKYNIKHSVEYISALWRNKIPKLISKYAEDEYLIWHYTFKEYGKWKRCSKCGQIKLAHNHFFSKNKTSKDGFYSICKECRNKKG